MQMQPTMAAYYPNNVTTDHIQQYLDENKSLILKIVESQNSGKISECAENQARLQRNLMYLAAIADSQPQPPTVHSQQMTPPSMLYAAQPYPTLQQNAAGGLMLQEGGGSSGNFIRGVGTKQDVGTGRQTLYFTGNEDGN